MIISAHVHSGIRKGTLSCIYKRCYETWDGSGFERLLSPCDLRLELRAGSEDETCTVVENCDMGKHLGGPHHASLWSLPKILSFGRSLHITALESLMAMCISFELSKCKFRSTGTLRPLIG
jgi:hypothetical protein